MSPNQQCQSTKGKSAKTTISILMATFPGEPGLASFIGAKDDGGGGDNWSYKTCKAPVESSSPLNKPTPSFLQAGCPSCHRTHSVKALKGNLQRQLIPQNSYNCPIE